jgi:hypothetical protein
MPAFILRHAHSPEECRVAFAAWKGFDSPLRHRHAPALGSCAQGGHGIWWTVEARDEQEALGHLPPFVADRTEVTEVVEVPIP